MNLLVRVDSREGEESTWMTYITEEELRKLRPLLDELKKNSGYFPTGTYLEDEPKPEILYSGYEGWNILKGRLPTPISGFKRILEIHVYNDPISLYM